MPVEIFFSYSHEDALLVDQLEKHLALLKRQGIIDMWRDRDIGAGMEWARNNRCTSEYCSNHSVACQF